MSLPQLIELFRSLSVAMDKRILEFDYSPDLKDYAPGRTVCVVSTVVSLDVHQQCHRMATVPNGQHFRYLGKIPEGMASHSLLLVKIERAGVVPTLKQTEESMCLSHPQCT